MANTGNLRLLVVNGKPNEVELLEAWEKIIKRNEKETGGNIFNSYFQLLKGYALLINEHTTQRAMLILLALKPIVWTDDKANIDYLRQKGYNIDVENLVVSVRAGLSRCENLITKAVMKRKELERLMEGRKETSHTFSDILVNLNMNVGFPVDENITLAMFNAYNKSLKARQKAEEAAQSKGKR